jgi:hypothetical protein
MTAETTYELDGRTWVQRFTAFRLTEAELGIELGRAGLEIRRWLDDSHDWLVAGRGQPAS